MIELLKLKQVSQVLQCSPSTVRRMVESGAIPPPLRLGGLQRWRMSDLEAMVEAPKERPETD
jgi:excisionase family DNA binding protein